MKTIKKWYNWIKNYSKLMSRIRSNHNGEMPPEYIELFAVIVSHPTIKKFFHWQFNKDGLTIKGKWLDEETK